MGPVDEELLARCSLPPPGAAVDLAVSGGPDSTGLLLIALAAGLNVTVHHVDHHSRPRSRADAALTAQLCRDLGVGFVLHDVTVEPGPNFEARARAARRAALPAGTLTGHTMDDLAETVVLNLVRGAGVDGLSPMVEDPTKPLLALRRDEVRSVVARASISAALDESNDDPRFARNRVRHEVLPLLNDVAGRDVVPLLARPAAGAGGDRAWLDALRPTAPDLDDADCRELRDWPRGAPARWLRARLRAPDAGDGAHPPSAAEVERALSVVRGEVVGDRARGGRRLSRRAPAPRPRGRTPLRCPTMGQSRDGSPPLGGARPGRRGGLGEGGRRPASASSVARSPRDYAAAPAAAGVRPQGRGQLHGRPDARHRAARRDRLHGRLVLRRGHQDQRGRADRQGPRRRPGRTATS